MHLEMIRRSLPGKGLTPASAVPELSGGLLEEPAIMPARLLEGLELLAIEMGAAVPWPDPVAYLDGVQRSELVGYLGSSPLLIAEIAAAVRERREGRLRTVLEEHRRIALGRQAVLEAAGDTVAKLDLIPLPDNEPAHPVRDILTAGRALDRARSSLERRLGDRYRSQCEAWLIVDGALSDSPRWSSDPKMVAVSRSHSILPFEGRNLDRYLRLPVHHRSSIYAPAARSVAPVCSWGLRLWPWEGKDLLHGLVRIEVAPENATPETADLISRWMLAERAPISAPAARWDRLLYGIHSVEDYLRARHI
jgi:hypothetical protein